MNLVIRVLVIICCFFISYVITTPHHCCPNNGIIAITWSTGSCKDGSNISLTCKNSMVLDPSRFSHQEFIIGNESDNDGKSYLDVYKTGYRIYQPYFCIGDGENRGKIESVAIVCEGSRKWYRDIEVEGHKEVQKAKIERILYEALFIFNIISVVLLLTTAAIYYALSIAQDVQETCYFYFTLFAGLAHLSVFYAMSFDSEGVIPSICITNLYISAYLILCAMCWSSVSSYNIWRTTMNYHTESEAELRRYYKIYGFGLPFSLIFLAWVHVHLKHIENLTFVLECLSHQLTVISIYLFIPVLVSVLANFLIFIHSQIRVWNLHTITLQDHKLTMKILKYRLFMNAKLFFIMGVPWAFLMVVVLANVFLDYYSTLTDIIGRVSEILITLEGLPIFAVLVLFRKRVLRRMANRWFVNKKIFPDKWKTVRGSETEDEVSDDETPSRSPGAKYTANSNDNNKNSFDDTVVVNL